MLKSIDNPSKLNKTIFYILPYYFSLHYNSQLADGQHLIKFTRHHQLTNNLIGTAFVLRNSPAVTGK